MADGLAFGTGSAIAHRAVGAMFGGGGSSNSSEPAPASAAAPAPAAAAPAESGRAAMCKPYQSEFAQCLQSNKSDIAACQIYSDQ
jgi:hypothetical protein